MRYLNIFFFYRWFAAKGTEMTVCIYLNSFFSSVKKTTRLLSVLRNPSSFISNGKKRILSNNKIWSKTKLNLL